MFFQQRLAIKYCVVACDDTGVFFEDGASIRCKKVFGEDIVVDVLGML